jgi:DNA-binding winged helix-turn-helix (wHTH) protein
LRSRGKIVSKDEIVRHVWPTTCVEESNLRFQMASLRKVLGTYRDSIKTIPGRGYLLASDLVERDQLDD